MRPPGVPAERVAILRKAFDAMIADPAFLQDAAKRKLPINASSGDKIQKIVADSVSAPKETVDDLRKVLGM